MAELLKFISSLAPWVQLVLCIVLALIFREQIWDLVKKALRVKETESAKQEMVPVWAQTLIAHFNHETTDNQKSISEGISNIHIKQDSMAKDISKIAENIDDMRVNGIRIRD